MNIKQYYLAEFPSHPNEVNINENATFKGLFEVLDTYGDACQYLGSDDLVIIERVFLKLSKLLRVSYNTVHAQFLMRD